MCRERKNRGTIIDRAVTRAGKQRLSEELLRTGGVGGEFGDGRLREADGGKGQTAEAGTRHCTGGRDNWEGKEWEWRKGGGDETQRARRQALTLKERTLICT